MPFQKGHPPMGGRPAGSPGLIVKQKYLAKWAEVFDELDTKKKLKELADKDFPEYCRLGLVAMPKEQNIDMNVNIFEGRSSEELEHFADTGEWPEEGKG